MSSEPTTEDTMSNEKDQGMEKYAVVQDPKEKEARTKAKRDIKKAKNGKK
tara:strand:- start:1409 stop:1558 length:150 start_codon:yes stop_codon:yes gene_type:complete